MPLTIRYQRRDFLLRGLVQLPYPSLPNEEAAELMFRAARELRRTFPNARRAAFFAADLEVAIGTLVRAACKRLRRFQG